MAPWLVSCHAPSTHQAWCRIEIYQNHLIHWSAAIAEPSALVQLATGPVLVAWQNASAAAVIAFAVRHSACHCSALKHRYLELLPCCHLSQCAHTI